MIKDMNRKFIKEKISAKIHMTNYASSTLKKSPQIIQNSHSFVQYHLPLMCLLGANITSVNKGKAVIMLCYHLKPLLELSLVLTHFFLLCEIWYKIS